MMGTSIKMVFSVGDLHVGTPTKSESDTIHEALL